MFIFIYSYPNFEREVEIAQFNILSTSEKPVKSLVKTIQQIKKP